MATILSTLAAPQTWPASVLILLLTTTVLLLSGVITSLIRHEALPSGAPVKKGWPLLGCLDFFSQRNEFLKLGCLRSSNGQFSFYYGAKSIVALSGSAARTAFFTQRGLDLSEGYNKLSSAGPDVKTLHGGDLTAFFVSMFKRMTNKESLTSVLRHLTSDTDAALTAVDTSAPVDPFELMYTLVYQLTHRTLGCNDIANDPVQLANTLAIYKRLDHSNGLQILFPRLPTPAKLIKLWAGARLHWTFKKIVDERKRTGRREEDAMQTLIDGDTSDMCISAFIIASLFAGLVNSGVNAAWILCYLAEDPLWMSKCRDEVDAAVAKHRLHENESAVAVLSRLELADWEAEFPNIDLCLRDSIRLNLIGVAMRKNMAGKDIKVGETGVVLPKDTFAVYPFDDVHMDSSIYQDPMKWDPSRYAPDRAEDKKFPHAYLGWGTGLHPCLGLKFAKLEIAITTATFLASFDFSLCDKDGKPRTAPLPQSDRKLFAPAFPTDKVYLKCSPRS